MRRFGTALLCVLIILATVIAADETPDGWKTYRSEKFGYALSYPPAMEYVAYFDGASGTLVDAKKGRSLAGFEVWPPSECSVPLEERTGTTAREVGIQRAGVMTQADGPAGSSHCGDPVRVFDTASIHGARVYELELACVQEEYPGSDDEDMDADRDIAGIGDGPVVTDAGIKGPTYFVDISQPWLVRVLMADPAGVDPRLYKQKDLAVSDDLRKILATVKTFRVPKPPGTCIQDLR